MMSDIIVKIEEGLLRGKIGCDYKDGQFLSFLGIPYGKNPIGDLRFKAPEPADPWDGIKDATQEGNECPSFNLVIKTVMGSEKGCLNLNVFTKDISESNLKPVMVWIHGGAFVHGSNRILLFGPGYLMSEDIVLVVINYRLGVFGFLSFEDPSLGVPGNAGMKDIVLALKWVQRNIKSFGGDPNNVTVFGESAGGAAVHYLLISTLSAGLFHKAIIQSGVSLNGWALVRHNSLAVAAYLGYKETDERRILEKLKQESTRYLLSCTSCFDDTFYGSSSRLFAPVVEKLSNEPAFLLENPFEIVKRGVYNQVPVIIGYNNLEGTLWEFLGRLKPRIPSKDCEIEVPHVFNLKMGSPESKEVANKLKQFYFNGAEPSQENIEKIYALNGDVNFLSGIHRAIYYLAEHSKQPIFVYKITLDGPLNLFKKICFSKILPLQIILLFITSKLSSHSYIRGIIHKFISVIPCKSVNGAGHADELGYIFQQDFSPKIAENTLEDVYIRRFIKLWTSFARFGNPTQNSENESVLDKLQWVTWNNEEKKYLEIGETLEIKEDPDRERVEFWKNLYEEFVGY